jgi:hypothetical protein
VLDNTQAVVAIAVGLVTRRDALVGREAVKDSITGRELSPALPGIGQRMANVETAIVAIAQQQQEIADLKVTVAVHDREIGKLADGQARLEAAAVERVVSKAESAAAWRAMEAVAHDPDRIEDEGRGTE